jgi:hypothetical protein
MNEKDINITGFGKQHGIRINTPEHRSYTFKYLPLNNTNEVRLGIANINTVAELIELIIRYMKHCSQECEIHMNNKKLIFHYTTSTSQ